MIQDQTYELFIRTTPEKLWSAITRGEESRKYFFATTVSMGETPGSAASWTFPDGTPAVKAELLEYLPGRSLKHTWRIQYDPACRDELSKVSWSIERRGRVCKLTVVHALGDAPNTAKNVGNEGWSVVLSGLKTLLETGESLELEMRN